MSVSSRYKHVDLPLNWQRKPEYVWSHWQALRLLLYAPWPRHGWLDLGAAYRNITLSHCRLVTLAWWYSIDIDRCIHFSSSSHFCVLVVLLLGATYEVATVITPESDNPVD